ncbi:MAG: bifunctional molybdenum cofactor biosynthesis protein MoaC/MoaB [Chitinophagia bacterium]|jgi:molybdenum cofactor biosynthesis protein MoaC|nr:bifunctional molybdenum cofactor biosynthesis protein MoaC/MoaB [Chitinophagia bacterium]NCA30552.1 bifunctional molybdenum cofactor biosynthesis protein MoaC/MoaB [Chitinophagia bacterium]
MVNITHKSSTLRKAIATGIVKVSDQNTIDAIQNKLVPKGDVFEFSRAAGLLACKKTYEVVPDCHPLPIEYTSISYAINGLEITITVEVHTVYKTGVEVEAMHGVMITALTMYDMLKPIDKHVQILNIQLAEKKGGKTDIKYAYPDTLKIAVITCSDSISKGVGEDKSGEIVVDHLQKHHLSVANKKVIADDFDSIQNEAKNLIKEGYQLIVFTGGTGLSSRDITPDAIKPLFEREVPGVMEAARAYGQERTPYAMLSRGIAGFVGDSLIITLPGSPKGAEESMNAIFPYILHVFRVKEGVKH